MAQRQLIENLRRQMRVAEQARPAGGEAARAGGAEGRVSLGVAALDRLFPGQGLPRGALVEWLAEPGGGAETLALHAARAALQATGGGLVVIDAAGDFYVPAAVRQGIAHSQLILIRPPTPADLLWACEQALRCRGVGAVLCGIDRLDDRTFRRLQLAAEAGAGRGGLLRPVCSRREATWADVRFLVEPRTAPPGSRGRWLEVRIERCRGGFEQRSATLEIDDETGDVRLVSELAFATAVRGTPRTEGERCSHGAAP